MNEGQLKKQFFDLIDNYLEYPAPIQESLQKVLGEVIKEFPLVIYDEKTNTTTLSGGSKERPLTFKDVTPTSPAIVDWFIKWFGEQK